MLFSSNENLWSVTSNFRWLNERSTSAELGGIEKIRLASFERFGSNASLFLQNSVSDKELFAATSKAGDKYKSSSSVSEFFSFECRFCDSLRKSQHSSFSSGV